MPRKLLLIGFAFAAILAHATSRGDSGFTSKERGQGYRDGVILAKPRASHRSAIDQIEAREHFKVKQKFERFEDVRVIELEPQDNVEDAVKRLQATGRYEFVEPDYLMHQDVAPNDPSFPLQWALNNTGQGTGYVVGADTRAVDAWDILHDAPDVIVALIDGGVRLDHQDIAPNLWRNPAPTFGDINGASFVGGVRGTDLADVAGHGTHVAGIICAAGNNGVGTAGIAWKTQLMVLKNARSDGSSSTSDSAACVDYAIAHGAKVINCSFGGAGYSNTFYTALRAARNAGVVVVCSAGNDGTNNDTTPHYPSNYLLDNIVAVGNSTPADTRSSSSNYGGLVELFAPGTSIVSSDFSSTSGVVLKSGTSMATPHVTGALVLMRAKFPNDSHTQLISRLLRTADYKSGLASYAATNGRLNVQAALLGANARPFNDDLLSSAITIGNAITLRGNNTDATIEGAEPPHTAGGTRSLWWLWIAPSSGTFYVDTAGSEYDTVLDIYTGSTFSFSALTPVASNDDNGTKTTSRTSLTATKSAYYFIAITGKNNTSGFTQLNIAPAAANDNFAGATTLTGESTQATGNNITASSEPDEPRILDRNPNATLWYKWTAPKTAQYQISSYTSDFDTLLAVYTGSSLTTLTQIAAGDDTDATTTIRNTDSRVTISAVAGTTYYVQIDTKTTSRGNVILTITDSLWQFTNDGAPFTGAPAIGADGTVYVGAASPDSRLYAINPDGSLKWTYATSGGMDNGGPAIGSDGTIYQGAFDGNIVALSPAGAVKWKKAFTGTAYSFMAIAKDGTLYAHTSEGYLYALNPNDGATKWRFNIGTSPSFASAVVAEDGTIYQGSYTNKTFYAINPDGSEKWHYDTNGDTFTTPALDSAGNIYLATYSTSSILSLSPNGTRRWVYSLTTSNAISSSPALSADGGTLYIGSADRRLYALDAATGALKWYYTCGDSILSSSPAVDAQGVIYIGAYDGKLYAINPNGTLKRTWDTAQRIRSSPAIFGTTLYIGSNDGKLYAFDIGTGVANGPWSQFRQNVRRTGLLQQEPLAITTAPQSRTVAPGETAVLSVVATGAGSLTYQWKKDGVAIAGATSSSYTIANAVAANAGSYTLTVTSSQGTVTSAAAVISVSAVSNPGRLTNMSIRTNAGTGDNTLIVGVTLGGQGTSGTKAVLVRGVGPTLGAFGVPGTLADPVLTAFKDNATVAQNDDWTGAFNFTSVGAFGFTGAPVRDAAIYEPAAQSGGYSVQIVGKNGGTGIALAEIYDATPGDSFTNTTPRLTNVSARTQVGTGDDILITGFTIGGSTSKRLLIRAVGPTLAAFGVSGTLADPILEIYDTQSKLLTSNDNWDSTAADATEVTAAGKSVGAFDLQAGAKDAARVITLQPGGYTAQVKGVGNTTGVALVEVYELP